jgi:dTDP-4-amino-4,6-dideoxygalactose transaminase
MASATMRSGSYMMYEKHSAGAPKSYFADVKFDTPNCSGRMDNLRAAILRPQLSHLEESVAAWNERYVRLEDGLRNTPGLTLIERPEKESYVGSSIQFLLAGWPSEKVEEVVKRCLALGVELKWFGNPLPVGFTSLYDSWRYAPKQSLPQSDEILKGLLDMRIPLTFSLEDCDHIAEIIKSEVRAVHVE